MATRSKPLRLTSPCRLLRWIGKLRSLPGSFLPGMPLIISGTVPLLWNNCLNEIDSVPEKRFGCHTRNRIDIWHKVFCSAFQKLKEQSFFAIFYCRVFLFSS